MKPIHFILLSILMIFSVQASCATENGLKADVEKALRWFPAETETIAVTKGFTLEQTAPSEDFEEGPAPLLDLFQSFIALGAYAIRGGKSIPFFADLRIRSLIEGARNFRPPHGLGLMSFEGATLFFLEAGQKEGKRAAFAGLAGSASSVLKINGERVLRFEEIFENDPWSFYLAWPEDELLIIATDEAYLSQILANLKGFPEQQALPESLIEWSYVDRESAFWALRHYSLTEGQKDPSSPFKKRKDGKVSDHGAVGFVVNVSESSDVQYLYLTSNLEATKEIQNSIPGEPRRTSEESEEESEPTKIKSTLEERPDGIHVLERYFPADMDPYERGSVHVEILWFLGFGLFL